MKTIKLTRKVREACATLLGGGRILAEEASALEIGGLTVQGKLTVEGTKIGQESRQIARALREREKAGGS